MVCLGIVVMKRLLVSPKLIWLGRSRTINLDDDGAGVAVSKTKDFSMQFLCHLRSEKPMHAIMSTPT
jgi:hypothetical protein